MSKFVHTADNNPVNLDRVAVIDQEGNLVNFLNTDGDKVYVWKFKTEESAFRMFNTLKHEHSEEL